MKIVILQSNFAKALNQVSRIVGTRTTLPVLSNILIIAEKGKIRFSATDLEVGITTQTIGKVEEEGSLTLPAKLISDFVLNNKDESIEITTNGTIAELKSNRFEATIHGIAAEEFPSVPEAPKEYFTSFKKADLIDALKKVAIAPATDETRPVLAGISFQFSGNELTLAATDSFRLAEKKLKLEKEVSERKLIVPSRTINEVLRVLAASEQADEAYLSATDNQISFKIGEAYIVSRLIEGAFINYAQIIPTSFKIEAKVNGSELIGAVKMSSLFARDSANNNIRVSIGKNELVVASVVSQSGSAKSKVAAETKGDTLEIAFNARYVLEVLNVLSAKEISILCNDSTQAAVIRVDEDPLYTYIIMPLKLEN